MRLGQRCNGFPPARARSTRSVAALALMPDATGGPTQAGQPSAQSQPAASSAAACITWSNVA